MHVARAKDTLPCISLIVLVSGTCLLTLHTVRLMINMLKKTTIVRCGVLNHIVAKCVLEQVLPCGLQRRARDGRWRARLSVDMLRVLR